MDQTLIEAISVISLLTFSTLIILAFARMFYRLGRYIFLHEKVPVLLKRDLVLFGVLGAYEFIILIFRIGGVSDLGSHPVWVLSTAIALNSAIAFWVWVEYFKIDN